MRSIFLGLFLLGTGEASTLPRESQLQIASTPSPATRPAMFTYAEEIANLWQNLRVPSPPRETQKAVLSSLRKLQDLSHDVAPALAHEAGDPVMLFLNFDLRTQLKSIEAAYSDRAYEKAHSLLRQSTQYCASCHALSAKKYGREGPFAWPDPQGLSELERGEYLSASRRHEEAMLAYEHALQDRKLKSKEPNLWQRAMVNLLALTIRIRQDPSITLEMISARLEEGSYSPQQTSLLKTWRIAAKNWAKEKQESSADPSVVLAKARELLEKGGKLNQGQNQGGYVELLRAASLLNGLTLSLASPDDKAEAYFLTGQVNEKLKDVFLWMRPQVYYEACIRLKPHTSLAKSCFSAWQTFTQSSPSEAADSDISAQLLELAQAEKDSR